MTDLSKLRGLKTLLVETVEKGATAVEGVHLATAARTFDLVGPAATPVKTAYEAWVSHTYTQIREITRQVGVALDAALDAAEHRV